jgi:hypothetical protein
MVISPAHLYIRLSWGQGFIICPLEQVESCGHENVLPTTRRSRAGWQVSGEAARIVRGNNRVTPNI